MFAKLKAFQSAAGRKIKSFSKDAIVCSIIVKISDQVGSILRSSKYRMTVSDTPIHVTNAG